MHMPRLWWTPRYLYNRVRLVLHERVNPESPWLNQNMIAILSDFLRTSDVGVEWGSGRGTVWLARRVGHLTSVEYDPVWYAQITRALDEAGLSNVNYVYHGADSNEQGHALTGLSNDSLDFALVDGGPRNVVANHALEKLRPGGVIILDDAHRFLPCDSVAPKSIPQGAPPRRATESERTPGLSWSDFLDRVEHWRRIWTSDGVTDAAMWFKPLNG